MGAITSGWRRGINCGEMARNLSADALKPAFFARPPAVVARALLGCTIVHGDRRALIVETEAYRGPTDLASHARFGLTPRTAIMHGPAGHAYVYLCYGVHEMFNVVTERQGRASAVLIRAAAVGDDHKIARGPGKLTKALSIDRSCNGVDLTKGDLFIIGRTVQPKISVGPRIGVDYAGASAALPLRFWWRDHPAVSAQKAKR